MTFYVYVFLMIGFYVLTEMYLYPNMDTKYSKPIFGALFTLSLALNLLLYMMDPGFLPLFTDNK